MAFFNWNRSRIVPQDPNRESIQLTLLDVCSGRSFTDTFAYGCSISEVMQRAKDAGILTPPEDKLLIFTQNGNRIFGSLDPTQEPGIHSGATLFIDLDMMQDPRFRTPEFRRKLRQTYPLVFFRKENGACIERIDFICYGYETPSDILSRMKEQNKLDRYQKYNIVYWPGIEIRGGRVMGGQHLCEFDPDPGRIFIIEVDDREPAPFACLYGCPTAALPRQKQALLHCHTDVIRYE